VKAWQMSSLKLTEAKYLHSMVEYFALLAEIMHYEVDAESFYGNISELHTCTLLFSVWKLNGCSGSGRETVFTRKQAFQVLLLPYFFAIHFRLRGDIH